MSVSDCESKSDFPLCVIVIMRTCRVELMGGGPFDGDSDPVMCYLSR